MRDTPRTADLRRRVESDPASIASAQPDILAARRATGVGESARSAPEPVVVDPVLVQLESWLDGILRDRTLRPGGDAAR